MRLAGCTALAFAHEGARFVVTARSATDCARVASEIGESEDLAEAAVFLASPAASFVTGEVLNV